MKFISFIVVLLISVSLKAQTEQKKTVKKVKKVKEAVEEVAAPIMRKQTILDLNYLVPMNRLYFEIESRYRSQKYTVKNETSEHPQTEYKNSKLNVDGRFSFSPMTNLVTSLFMELAIKNKKEIIEATKSNGVSKQPSTVDNINDEFFNEETISNWGIENFGIEVKYRLMRNTHGLFDLDLLLSFSPNLIDAERGVQYEALSRFYSTDGNGARGSHEFVFGAEIYKNFGDLSVGSYAHGVFNSSTDISEIEGDTISSDATQRRDQDKEIDSYLSLAFGLSGQFFFTPTVAAKLFVDFNAVPELTTTYDSNSGATFLQYKLEETQESYLQTSMGLEFSILTSTDSKVTLGGGFDLMPDIGTTTSQTSTQSGNVVQLTPTEQTERSSWYAYFNGAITF